MEQIKISFFTGVMVALVLKIVSSLWNNRKNIKLWSCSLLNFKTDIRVTSSYIFRIKIDSKYALIEGRNIVQLQPVGGVYKYYSSFESFKEDNKIIDESPDRYHENGDLRLIMKGRTLPKYIEWFSKMKNREVSVIREVVEELQISDLNRFIENTQIEFVKRVINQIGYSKHFKMKEQQIFDVYELRILSDDFREELKSLENITLVDIDDINKECYNRDGKSQQVAMTSKYII